MVALLVLSACSPGPVPASLGTTNATFSFGSVAASREASSPGLSTGAAAGSTSPGQPTASAASNRPATVSGSSKPSASPKNGQVTKLLVIVEENHSFDQMTQQMPYLNRLAERFAYADHYTAIRHPSLPNYLAIIGGDTAGVTDDAEPSRHVIHGQSVFGQALAAKRTAKAYEESMAMNCAASGGAVKGYAVKHNPWAYYIDERTACKAFDVAASSFVADAQASQLPNVGLLVPNLCNDAHDRALGCDLGTADRYLASVLPAVLGSSDFKSGDLAVVVTADEDDNSSQDTTGGSVLTVVLQAGLDGSHRVVATPLTHYSLSRMYSQVVGAAPLNEAAAAPDMATAFNLTVG